MINNLLLKILKINGIPTVLTDQWIVYQLAVANLNAARKRVINWSLDQYSVTLLCQTTHGCGDGVDNTRCLDEPGGLRFQLKRLLYQVRSVSK